MERRKLQKTIFATVFLSIALITGCQNISQSSDHSQKVNLLGQFSVPANEILLSLPSERLNEQDQAIILRLSMMLDTQAKTKKDRSEIFYELGIVYDRLGLEATARSMFMNALVENPSFAAPYNFVGIYFAKDGRFQDACDAFDSALELNPKETYIYFNRALVLHYANRDILALDDLRTFLQSDPNDPYRLLWMYIVEHKVLGKSQAQKLLRGRLSQIPKKTVEENWGFNLVKLYLNELDETVFWEQVKGYREDLEAYTDHLCEAYFYLAKLHLLQGLDKLAYDEFHLASATRRFGFLEYRYALIEINALEKRYKLNSANRSNILAI